MKRTAAWMPALALAGVLVLAGCGDDEQEAAPLSRQEFIAQADAICKQGNRDLAQASALYGNNPSPAQLERFAEQELAPGIQGQIDRIAELDPPEADEQRVAAILDAAQAGIDSLQSDPEQLAENADTFAEANQLASDYGLKVCGR